MFSATRRMRPSSAKPGVNLPPQVAESILHDEHREPADYPIQLSNLVRAMCDRAGGAPTRLLGLTWRREFQAVVTTGDSSLRKVKDLRDRKIGLPLATQDNTVNRACAMRGMVAALEVHGLFHRHVEWTDVPDGRSAGRDTDPYAAEIDALLRKQVDAVYLMGAAGVAAARAVGARILFDAGNHPDEWIRTHSATPAAFTVEESTVRRYPELIRHLPPHVWAPSTPGLLQSFKQFLLRWRFIGSDIDLNSWAVVDTREPVRLTSQPL